MDDRGPGLGPQQAPRARVGRGNARHIPPDPPFLEGPLSSSSPSSAPLAPMPLRLTRSEGALEGRGPGRGAQQASRGLPRWGKRKLHSLPDPPIPEGPSPFASPLLSPRLSHAPRIHMARRGPGGQRTRPGTPAGFPGPNWAGEMLATFPSDPPNPQGSLKAWEPLPFPSHPSGVLFPFGLYFSSPLAPPYVLPCHLGVPPVPLGVEVPHQHLVGALVVERGKLCVLPLCHLDSAPHSSNFLKV